MRTDVPAVAAVALNRIMREYAGHEGAATDPSSAAKITFAKTEEEPD